jgi:hypothetical protein
LPHSIKVITGHSKCQNFSSILNGATNKLYKTDIIMGISFKYNGKIWNPKNPEKKLKQLGITWDDVEIIKEEEKKVDPIEYLNPRLFIFKNEKTGETIESIYNNLWNLKDTININDYIYGGEKRYN